MSTYERYILYNKNRLSFKYADINDYLKESSKWNDVLKQSSNATGICKI